jgi:nitrogen fixation protein FixH
VEATCTQFLYNLNNHEYAQAKLLATAATVKKIEFIENLNKMAGGGKVIVKDIKTSLVGCTEDKKEAVCTYKTFAGGEQKVYLLKQKGRWLVDLRADAMKKE